MVRCTSIVEVSASFAAPPPTAIPLDVAVKPSVLPVQLLVLALVWRFKRRGALGVEVGAAKVLLVVGSRQHVDVVQPFGDSKAEVGLPPVVTLMNLPNGQGRRGKISLAALHYGRRCNKLYWCRNCWSCSPPPCYTSFGDQPLSEDADKTQRCTFCVVWRRALRD